MVENIKKEYFDWMVDKIGGRGMYDKLLDLLFNTPFVYIFPMDGNRYEDGIDLRYRFGIEKDIPQPVIANYLDCVDCSLLEMMVALALRCEEHIMADDDLGDRTAVWFWEMIISLGLLDFKNENYDTDKILDIVDRLYNRAYSADGRGGLFRTRNQNIDMRRIEIWDQAMAYFNEVLDDEK